jgi:CDP-glucose 4,6-dehydratase
MLAQALHERGAKFNGGWNFGPSDDDTRSVADVIDLLIDRWPTKAAWIQDPTEQPHEARSLKLDCSKAHQYLRWSPSWGLETAINMIADWSNAHRAGADMRAISAEQINNYINS